MLHSILGAYTCYRPDVGYVSEPFQYFIMLPFKKSQNMAQHNLAANVRLSAFIFLLLLRGMESLVVKELPPFSCKGLSQFGRSVTLITL